jgi:hypothetical protein
MSNGNTRTVRVQTLFSYPTTVELAAVGEESTVLRIESATDFLWFKSTYHTEIDPAAALTDQTRIIPLVDVQIQVSGADRNLFQAPTPIPNVFGTGQIPFVLPSPMVLLANSEVRFDFTSRDPRALRLTLNLIGLKDYGELRRPEAA